MVTLTYLLVGKVLNVFWCANQNLKVQNSTVIVDSETNSCSLEFFGYLASVWFWFQCGNAISEINSELKGFPMYEKWVGYIKQMHFFFQLNHKFFGTITQLKTYFDACIGRLRKIGGQKIDFISLLLNKFS